MNLFHLVDWKCTAKWQRMKKISVIETRNFNLFSLQKNINYHMILLLVHATICFACYISYSLTSLLLHFQSFCSFIINFRCFGYFINYRALFYCVTHVWLSCATFAVSCYALFVTSCLLFFCAKSLKFIIHENVMTKHKFVLFLFFFRHH